MRISGTGSWLGSGVTTPVPRWCWTMLHEPSLGRMTLPRTAAAKTISLPLAPKELLTSKRLRRICWPVWPMSMMQSSGSADRLGLVVEQRLVGFFGQRDAARGQLDETHDPFRRHAPIDLALHHAFDLHVGIEEDHLQQGVHGHVRAGFGMVKYCYRPGSIRRGG